MQRTHNPLVRKIGGLIKELNQFDPRHISRLALEAMLVFEGVRGFTESSGYSVPVATNQEVEGLKEALIRVVDRSECCPPEVIAALDALREPALAAVFRRCLSCNIAAQHAGGMYDAMTALDALGEDVFGGRQSRSILDWEVNRQSAAIYLKSYRDPAE